MDNDGPILMLEVVTPEGRVEKTQASLVEFPSGLGELGIFPGHASVIVEVSAGELRVHREDGMHVFAIAGGFAQINPDSIRMIISFASDGAIEEAEIGAACERAKEALESAGTVPAVTIEADVALLKTELMHLREKKRSGSAVRVV